MTVRTVQIIQDPDDADQVLLDLGPELCQELGWHPGDRLVWQLGEDGSVTLHKWTPPRGWSEQEEEAWHELEQRIRNAHGSG
jgi:hypothetical protein